VGLCHKPSELNGSSKNFQPEGLFQRFRIRLWSNHKAALIIETAVCGDNMQVENANAATEYPIFCRRWPKRKFSGKKEIPVAEVVRRADRTLPRLIQDWVAGYFFENIDSKKVLRGDGMVTINTMPPKPG